MQLEGVENSYSKIWFNDNKIMCCEYKVNQLDIAIAKECVSLRIEAAHNSSYPTLIDVRQVKSISKEAREYLASDAGSKYIKASALLINSTIGKIMGNFFLQINKPKIPVRLFSNENEALNWLSQYVKN